MRSPVPLPLDAAAKLAELEMQRDSALDASHSCQGRMNGLPADAAGLRERLIAERDKHAGRHRVLAQVVSRCNQFVMEARGVLEPAPTVDIKLKAEESPRDAVERLRGEIAGIKRELITVRAASLPLDAQKQLVAEAVRERAASGRPTVAFASDAASISWRENTSMISVLAWLQPDAMIAALSAELVERPRALPAEERMRKVAELEGCLLGLERAESALIEQAAVLPRVDVDPRAFLGVNVVPANSRAVEAA